MLLSQRKAGLYEKWSRDLMSAARQESRRKILEEMKRSVAADLASKDSGLEALSLNHLQGPLYIFILGCIAGFLVFIGELVVHKVSK